MLLNFILLVLVECSFTVLPSFGCAEFPDVQGRWVSYAGDTAFFVCEGNLALVGDSETTCGENGWLGEGKCAPNVALSCSAVQSTTYNSDGVAGNAVDGTRSGLYGSQSCTHTTSITSPYWSVNLGFQYTVRKIRIYNRIEGTTAERLLGAVVRVGPFDDILDNGVVAVLDIDKIRQNPIEIDLNVNANHVGVRIPGASKLLTLCEVEVYGFPL